MFRLWRWYLFETLICILSSIRFGLYIQPFVLAASTHDQEVFSFYPDEKFCSGFEEVLTRYRKLVPQLRLAGKQTPTLSFPLHLY